MEHLRFPTLKGIVEIKPKAEGVKPLGATCVVSGMTKESVTYALQKKIEKILDK